MLLKMIKQIPKKISLIIKVSSQLSLFSERLFNLGLGWVGLGWVGLSWVFGVNYSLLGGKFYRLPSERSP